MKRPWIRVGVLLFFVGTAIGLFFNKTARATSPAGGSAWPKSVYYTERWSAIQGFMNTQNGYRPITDFEHNTAVSGVIEEDAAGVPYVKTSPDLFVTKWRVTGHIHFK